MHEDTCNICHEQLKDGELVDDYGRSHLVCRQAHEVIDRMSECLVTASIVEQLD
jgi:transcription initiation factor TFIIIB Brf1 subunit/transcription initiation factor TFIIB